MDWINEYIKFLGCVDPNDLRVEEAMQLKDKNLPAKLFKYRPASDYAIENLKTDTVWLNKPSEYNDPFEFAEFIDFSRLQSRLNDKAGFDIVAHFAEKYPVPEDVKQAAAMTVDPMEKLIDYALKNEGRNDLEIGIFKTAMREVVKSEYAKALQWKIDLMQDQMKVCSFCESHDHLLMWSHYANYHTGFCVEYDITQWKVDDLRRRLIYPAIYQDSLYDATDHLLQNLNGNDGFNPLYAIISGSTKSSEWSYEKEWRFIFNIGGSFQKQNYRMNCQAKVYLGYRMEEEKRSLITAICDKKNIPVFQARPASDRYQLEFEKVKNKDIKTIAQ